MDVSADSGDDIISVTLSLDASGAYGNGEVLAASQEVTNFVRGEGRAVIIDQILVLDEDDQAGAFDLLFFNANTDIGAENGALAFTDTEARALLGWVAIAAADYVDWGDFRIATSKRGDSAFKLSLLKPAVGTSIWVAAISRDTKTYTAAGIKLKLHRLGS